MKKLRDRIDVARWDRKQAAAARGAAKTVATKANKYYNNGSTEANIEEYLRHQTQHAEMEANGLEFKQWVTATDALISYKNRTITSETLHAKENRDLKPDRVDMSIERAQAFINNAKIVIYQSDRGTIKYIAADGYTVLSMSNELVTAVPQKWRKKYDKFLEAYNETSK